MFFSLRKIAFLVVLALVSTTSVFAQEVTLTSKAKAMYLGVDGARFYDESPVVQSDIFVGWKNGVYVDGWASTAANKALKFDKEVDVTLGKSGNIGRAKYDLNTGYFMVQGIDVMNHNVELGFKSQFIRLEAYNPAQKGGPGKGLQALVGARQALQAGKHVTVDLQGWVRGDSGCFGFDNALLTQGYGGVRMSLGHTNIIAGARFSAPVSHVSDGRKKELVWEFGFSQNF